MANRSSGLLKNCPIRTSFPAGAGSAGRDCPQTGRQASCWHARDETGARRIVASVRPDRESLRRQPGKVRRDTWDDHAKDAGIDQQPADVARQVLDW